MLNAWEENVRDKIRATLECGVPFRIADLRQRGGPQPIDLDIAREFSGDLASHGDVLMFGSHKDGEVASLMNGLIHAIAVMAFQPGGVTVFGSRFEA